MHIVRLIKMLERLNIISWLFHLLWFYEFSTWLWSLKWPALIWLLGGNEFLLQEGKAVFCGNTELMKWICLVKWWKLIELKCPIVWYWCFWSFWVSSQHLMDDFQRRGTQRILRNRSSAAVHLYAWEPSPGQYSIIIKRLRREKKLCILASVNNRDLMFV